MIRGLNSFHDCRVKKVTINCPGHSGKVHVLKINKDINKSVPSSVIAKYGELVFESVSVKEASANKWLCFNLVVTDES